jgi:SAM-dependent methyltransferase
MTKILIAALRGGVEPNAAVLDYCSGSGAIAAALLLRVPSIDVHLLDADAVAIAAAKRNLASAAAAAENEFSAAVEEEDEEEPSSDDGAPPAAPPAAPGSGAASFHLSDGWSALAPRDAKFDVIVSNPPVHNGERTDLRVLQELVRGGAVHLAPGGSLFIVAQESIPVGAMLSAARLGGSADGPAAYGAIELVADATQRGRFHVWRAMRGADAAAAAASAAATAAATAATLGKKRKKKKRHRKKAQAAKRPRQT